MTTATASYELLLFLVNTLQTNAQTITATVITESGALDNEESLSAAWAGLSAHDQDEIAADVQHVLDGIGKDLAFLI